MGDLINPQTITSGAYAMESVAWLCASLMVVTRTVRATLRATTLRKAYQVLEQRGAKFALSFGALLIMGFSNRFKWWWLHTFTDQAYSNYDYTVAIQSAIITLILFAVVANLNGREDLFFGLRNSRVLAILALIALVGSTLMYAGIR